MTSKIIFSVGALAAAVSFSCGSGTKACGPNPAGYTPTIGAANFSRTIDTRWLFYPQGAVFTYVQTSGEIVEQDVLPQTRTIMGVTALTVHDFLKSPAGDLLEDTYDYYAQDTAGNVWY